MKRLLFGGTFNPVHNGHLHLLDALRRAVEPDAVLIMPTYLPVHKQVGEDFLEPAHRLAMCRLAFASADTEISDWETRQGKACYTVDTLAHLQQQYPGDVWYLACGSDMFLSFDAWKQYRDIYKMAVICAVSRGDQLAQMRSFAAEQAKLGMRCVLSEAPPYPVSSTEIRARIRRGESVANDLPPSVAAYIQEHQVYRGTR